MKNVLTYPTVLLYTRPQYMLAVQVLSHTAQFHIVYVDLDNYLRYALYNISVVRLLHDNLPYQYQVPECLEGIFIDFHFFSH